MSILLSLLLWDVKAAAMIDFPFENYVPPDIGSGRWVHWPFHGRIDVAGVQHHRDDALRAFAFTSSNDYVELIRDPDNENDRNAIQVWLSGLCVGFVDRHTASAAAKLLPKQMPICARYVDGWHGETGYIRLTVQPLMPDAKTRLSNGWVIKKPRSFATKGVEEI